MLVIDIEGCMDRITMAGHHCLKREVSRRESCGEMQDWTPNIHLRDPSVVTLEYFGV